MRTGSVAQTISAAFVVLNVVCPLSVITASVTPRSRTHVSFDVLPEVDANPDVRQLKCVFMVPRFVTQETLKRAALNISDVCACAVTWSCQGSADDRINRTWLVPVAIDNVGRGHSSLGPDQKVCACHVGCDCWADSSATNIVIRDNTNMDTPDKVAAPTNNRTSPDQPRPKGQGGAIRTLVMVAVLSSVAVAIGLVLYCYNIWRLGGGELTLYRRWANMSISSKRSSSIHRHTIRPENSITNRQCDAENPAWNSQGHLEPLFGDSPDARVQLIP